MIGFGLWFFAKQAAPIRVGALHLVRFPRAPRALSAQPAGPPSTPGPSQYTGGKRRSGRARVRGATQNPWGLRAGRRTGAERAGAPRPPHGASPAPIPSSAAQPPVCASLLRRAAAPQEMRRGGSRREPALSPAGVAAGDCRPRALLSFWHMVRNSAKHAPCR